MEANAAVSRMDLENPLSTPETQLSLAEDLAVKIRGGADFTELAKEHSADAYAAEGGLQEDGVSAEWIRVIHNGVEPARLG